MPAPDGFLCPKYGGLFSFKFFIEIDLDFEIDNHMHNLNSDRIGVNHKTGMLWAPRMHSMLRLEYHNFEGRQGLGKREGLMLVLMFDGFKW